MTQTANLAKQSTEEEARHVAESARQKVWRAPSFLKDLYLGSLNLDLLTPYPLVDKAGRPEFKTFFESFRKFVKDNIDPNAIDESGEYPQAVIDGLKDLGAFGMKVPTEYGGLGLSQVEYNQVMEFIGGLDANITALLSAHQSIGVPQPIKLFGTSEQKENYLRRCAKGAISAFALTEPSVGSDPSSLSTTAVAAPDGDGYILNGTKLWCTNGTLAELIVVMAAHPETKRISAFVVEMNAPGVTVEKRCHFMGHRALANAVIDFKDVHVPRMGLIGKEGAGLKIALITLNTGRLSLPAAATGCIKRCLEICRAWANERVQWGLPIGKHEAITHMLADMAATGFAMESVSQLGALLADRKNYDIRLEAAAAKEFNSTEGWRLIDNTMQIRGGRGYETESSLAARGDEPVSVERMFRDFRINRIFEGSSEIMHLFIAREAVDKHLSIAGDIIDKKVSFLDKLKALPKIIAFYSWWYPTRWIGWGRWPRFLSYGSQGKHLCFIDRNTRKLARQTFHGMIIHQAKLEKKQGFMFRIVDIGLELFAMTTVVMRAKAMGDIQDPNAERAKELANAFCCASRRRIKHLFNQLWCNDDNSETRLGLEVLGGSEAWFEVEDVTNSEK